MKKSPLTAFLIGIFLIISGNLQAQLQGQPLIDSLLQELPAAAKDTHQVLLLNQLGRTYAGIDPEEAFKYSNQALTLATQLNSPKARRWPITTAA